MRDKRGRAEREREGEREAGLTEDGGRRGGRRTFANETILSGRPIEKSERERERECPKKRKKEREGDKGGLGGYGIFFLVRPTDDKAKQQKESPARLLRKEQINLNIAFFLPVKYLKQCRGETMGVFFFWSKRLYCVDNSLPGPVFTQHM